MSANQIAIVTRAQIEDLERLYPGDIFRGYIDGSTGAPWPDRDPSPAYEHGRRNAVNDKAGIVDPDQRLLAGDLVRKGLS